VPPPPAELVRYGPDPEQVANLHRPSREGGPWPVVVVLHGGFWRDRFDRTLMTPLANDLAARGYLAWNVEYRRVGREGGGWPGTLEDVAAAVDALVDVAQADTSRVATLGHSAGGHLALWLAAGDGAVRPRAAVSLAGVSDLVRGSELGLGSGAVEDFLGGAPDEVPERYAEASPAALLPLGAAQLLVHGGRDDVVPIELARPYAEAARSAGDHVELLEDAHADHFDVVDPAHHLWGCVVARLPALLGVAG
jgi:acetyl esterase/lipase